MTDLAPMTPEFEARWEAAWLVRSLRKDVRYGLQELPKAELEDYLRIHVNAMFTGEHAFDSGHGTVLWLGTPNEIRTKIEVAEQLLSKMN